MTDQNTTPGDQGSGKKKKKSDEDFAIQEYKLVPVESIEDEENEHQISIFDLIRTFWDNRKRIYRYTAIGIVIGVITAFVLPVEYQASVTLMPEVTGEQAAGGLNGALQKYGSLLGIGGGGLLSGNSSSLNVMLYPKIVNSIPFQKSILDEEIYSSEFDTTVTVKTYFSELHSPGIFNLLYKYTIGLPYQIKNAITGDEIRSGSAVSQNSEIKSITLEEFKIIEKLRERVNLSIDEESGTVSITVQMPEPQVAASLTQFSVEELTKYVTEYRIEKASQDLEFINNQMMDAKKRYETAQLAVASYLDENQGNLTNKSQTELEQLNSMRNLTESLYTSLAQQHEEAKIRLQEETPIFKVLQPVYVPVEKSKPSRTVILIMITALAVLLAMVLIFVKEYTELDQLIFSRMNKPSVD